MSDKVVISAALTGVLATREQCPAIPYTPAEIAAEAKRAADAGAAIVHIHARTPEGGPEWRVETFAEIMPMFRSPLQPDFSRLSLQALATSVESFRKRPAYENPPERLVVAGGGAVKLVSNL